MTAPTWMYVDLPLHVARPLPLCVVALSHMSNALWVLGLKERFACVPFTYVNECEQMTFKRVSPRWVFMMS